MCHISHVDRNFSVMIFLEKYFSWAFERKNAQSQANHRKDKELNTQAEGDINYSFKISRKQLQHKIETHL